MLTVVMYHFVRDLVNSRYPEIKGLDVQKFNLQIEFLKNNYNIIRTEDLIESIYAGKKLPKNSVLLTFDDAYSDHYLNVFPILDYHKLQGSFYTPVRTITENKVLDVNKIHFILASTSIQEILNCIKENLDANINSIGIKSFDEYFIELASASRFDTAEVIFVKRLLQHALPEEYRNLLVDELFKKFIKIDEDVFSRELYLNENQYKMMLRKGMHFGGHSFDHFWLNTLTKEEQEIQIIKSKKFLIEAGVNKNELTFCYPYGGHNSTTIELLEKHDFKLAFTTEVKVLDLKSNFNRFQIPRLDTNDIKHS
jgi:peptidoglycan/xylan/chitin deacetylase (PgdA/CDA1 family)